MNSLLLSLLVGSIPALYQFYRNTTFVISNLQKDFHQDNLSFVFLQIYKYNCLNILADNISCHKQVKNQWKSL